MEETLKKILDDLSFVRDGLREALSKGNNVEALVILPLIGRAVELRRDVEQLLIAHGADKTAIAKPRGGKEDEAIYLLRLLSGTRKQRCML